MRKLMLGAAAIAALLVPAQASAETNGYVDLSVGQTSVESTDLDSITIGGAAAVDLSENWRAQFDVDVNRLSVEDAAFTLTTAAAHVYYEGDGWAVGGVLSNRDLLIASAWTVGIEGQTHLGSVVLEGEAGFGTVEAGSGDAGVVNADANATWYISPNFSIGLGIAYLDIDEFAEVTTYGIDGEYKFQNSQFSVFGGYSQTDVEDEEIDGWRIGARYAFGDDTLQGRRQSGPRWLRSASGLLPL